MKKILLTQNQYTIIDNEDFKKVNQFKWSLDKCNNYFYVRRLKQKNNIKTKIYLHRFIMNCPDNMQIDHINHNTLDNRKCNLRICTKSQNQINRLKRKNCSSKYKGVYLHKQNQKWISEINYLGKKIYLGCFKTEKEAAKVYNKIVKKYHGEYVYLNNV